MGISVGDKNVTELAVGNKLCEKGYEENAYIYGKSASRVKFSYTGSEQTFTIPKDGIYKFEVRGAAGGTDNRGNLGGRGGYACGSIFLSAGTVLKIYVGEKGKTGGGSLTDYAFNGGGRGGRSNYKSSNWGNGGGGGASDIRIGGNTLYHRLLVGGGGGGASPNRSDNQNIMCGGGEQGNSPRSGAQGTQTDGNAFGVGFSSTCNNEGNRYSCNGGGGGWYGGGKGGSTGSSDSWSDSFYAGGGSGFVRTGQTTVPAEYLVSEDYVLSETQNIKGNESMPNLDGTGTMTGNTGNGCVVISCPFFIPPKEKVTQAGAYHNPDLGLISISSDGENWITISDKDVGAQDVLEAGKTLQYGNIYGFPGGGDDTPITTSSVVPSLSGYCGGNLYSNSTYRTNASWNEGNKNLWKGIAFNLKSLERGPCPIGFHVPTVEEVQALMQVAGNVAGEGTNVSYETLNQYLLLSHFEARQSNGGFAANTTFYLTNSYVNNQNKLKVLRIYGEEGEESVGIVQMSMNCGGYIRPFRDKAIVPTTGWTRLPSGGNTVRLPLTYQEVDYIESSGTQYINTGYIPNVNTEIETRLSWGSSQIAWAVFYGVTSNDKALDGVLGRLYYASDTGNTRTYNWWFCNSDYAETKIETTNDVFHDIKSKKNVCTLDGTEYTITTTGTPYQAAIFLFCGNNGGTAWRYANCKMGDFVIKEGDEEKRHFVPCYRRIDGAIGMYDLVTETFYANAGADSFTKGADVNIPELPATYQEVKYIEQTGTQYIDTGVIPTEKTLSRIKFMNLETTGDIIYGYNPDNDTADYRFFNASGANYLDFPGGSGSGNRLTGGTCSANTIYEYEIGNFYVKDLVSGTNVLSGTAIGAFTGIRNITLGWSYVNNNSSKNRWYYVKIYESGTLVRDFVPCYRVSDGAGGLYDLVEGKFYGNSGTGTFIKGAPVNV